MKSSRIIFRLCSILLLPVLLLFPLAGCREKTYTRGGSPGLVRDLVWPVGIPLPAASDFAGEEALDASFTFVGNPFEQVQLGENPVRILVRQKKGGAVACDAVFTLVQDTEAPKMTVLPKLYTSVGQRGVSYWNDVTVTDNCDAPVSRSVDNEKVNFDQPGSYEVIYRLTDAVGNTATVPVTLYVFEQEITQEMLDAELDPLIASLGLQGLSKLEQCRRIYEYVNDDKTVSYNASGGKSNDPSRVSWVREAYLALQSKKGDCYTYYALSKAFFERLGIENRDLQRTPGLTKDTHYWLMVNVGGEGSASKWYHFDATRLMEKIYDGGILTDAQVRYYSENIRSNFYAYDAGNYPVSETAEVCGRI